MSITVLKETCVLKRKCNGSLERPKLALASSVAEKRDKEDKKHSSLSTQCPVFVNTAQHIGYVLKCKSIVNETFGI